MIDLFERGWKYDDLIFYGAIPVLLLGLSWYQGLLASKAFYSAQLKFGGNESSLDKKIVYPKSRFQNPLKVLGLLLVFVFLVFLGRIILHGVDLIEDPSFIFFDTNTKVFYGIQLVFLVYLINRLGFLIMSFSWKKLQGMGAKHLS